MKKKISISVHTFINFDFEKYNKKKPESDSWYTQYHHKKKAEDNDWGTVDDINVLSDIPKELRFSLFLLIIADHLATPSSRSTLEKAGFTPEDKDIKIQKKILSDLGISRLDNARGLIKLWNKKFYQNEEEEENQWAAYKDESDLKIMFDEIQKIDSGEDFLNKYKSYLFLTPEDKSFPRNITSLFTHLDLTGKIFRILQKSITQIEEDNCRKLYKE